MSPATSSKQQTLACIALAIKRGEQPKTYSKQAAEMAASMSEEDLKHYCESPVKKE